MQASVPSTAEVLALRKLGRSIDARWVDWAVRKLLEGRDTPCLRVLAGEVGPFNQFEMAALVDRTFEELGLQQYPSRKEAAVAYASVLAGRILSGVLPADVALAELAQLCIELDYLKDVRDFYLLHFAREDLQATGMQYYWPEGDQESIDDVIREYCRKWIREHSLDVQPTDSPDGASRRR